MKLYDFSNLIKKYSVSFQVKGAGGGHYEDGEYVPNEVEAVDRRGAIVPLSNQRIYQSGGSLTAKDKQLYSATPVAEALEGAKILFKGNSFSIQSDTEFEDYADVYIYLLKWVSVFDRHETN